MDRDRRRSSEANQDPISKLEIPKVVDNNDNNVNEPQANDLQLSPEPPETTQTGSHSRRASEQIRVKPTLN